MIGNGTINNCNQVIGRTLVSSNHTNNQDINNMVKEIYDLQQLALANSHLIECQHEEQLKEKQNLTKDYETIIEQLKKELEELKARLAACESRNNNNNNIINNINSDQHYYENQQQQFILHPNVQHHQATVPQFFNQQAQVTPDNTVYEQQSYYPPLFIDNDSSLQLHDQFSNYSDLMMMNGVDPHLDTIE